jgi:hypothetical protein
MKKGSALFTTALIIAIVTILLGIYYLIPHIWHPFVFLDHPFFFVNSPLVNYNAHKKYTAVFFAIAALASFCAFLMRPKSKEIRYN